jgi:tetratricopeptide (TPR) repeat protein
VLSEVLSLQPEHAEALHLRELVAAEAGTSPTRAARESLLSYDMEELGATEAMPHAASRKLDIVDAPFGGLSDDPLGDMPLPSFPLRGDNDDLMAGLDQGSGRYSDLDQVDDISEFVQEQPSEAVEEALDESEFFASRGLYDDARAVLTDQLARTPRHPLLTERLRELDEIAAATGASRTIERSALDHGGARARRSYHDDVVASSLDALDEMELPPESVAAPQLMVPANDEVVDQVFNKFKAGVRAQVAENDSATHYDVAFAYKDMGLLAEAVNEFELAARDPQRECMCHAMVGLIYLEQDKYDEAAEAYTKALNASHKTIEQEMSLYYDLGVVYEMKKSNKEALYYFQKIARRDPGYRDGELKDRIEALQPDRRPAPAAPAPRAVNDEDDFDRAFDDLFDGK